MPDTPEPSPLLRPVTVACPKCGHEHNYALDISSAWPVVAVCKCENRDCEAMFSVSLAFDVAPLPRKQKCGPASGPLRLAE